MIIDFVLDKRFYLPISYITVGIIIYLVICSVINRALNLKNKHINVKKQNTIVNLIKSVFKYLIVIIVIIMILSLYGVDTSSIIASIGIVGVVIGLAFQDILKNLLAGISIIFDNHYMVGDTVKINDFTGEVISLGLQSTKIKSYTGEVFIIGNSQITNVVNYSQEDSRVVIGIPVSYDTDISKLEDVLEGLRSKIEGISDVISYELLGVDDLADSAIIYKVVISCVSNSQYGVRRRALRVILDGFKKEKIEIPYSKLDVYMK